MSRSTCGTGRQRPPGTPAPAARPSSPARRAGHLQLQVAVAHERGAPLLALAGQAQGQVVVLVLAALELAAAHLAGLLEPLHTLLVLAQQAVLHPQLLDEVVLGAQQCRQVLHLLLQLHHLAHQQLHQA